MLIITETRLRDFGNIHKESESLINAWITTVRAVQWTKFADVKQTFNSTDSANGFLIFNVNSNRIVAGVAYQRATPSGETIGGTLYIRHVFTHAEYNAWSAPKKRKRK